MITAADLAAATAAAPHRLARLVAREQGEVRTLLALRAVVAAGGELSRLDATRLAMAERGSAARLRGRFPDGDRGVTPGARRPSTCGSGGASASGPRTGPQLVR